MDYFERKKKLAAYLVMVRAGDEVNVMTRYGHEVAVMKVRKAEGDVTVWTEIHPCGAVLVIFND